MNFWILSLLGYLLGSVPFGVMVARTKGIDILKVGSGNPGATNVWRNLGAKAGLLVFALDIAKGLIPAAVGTALLEDKQLGMLCGIAAVLGHSFSPWLKFKGGKGIATGFGALLGSSPFVGLSAFGVFLLSLAISRYVSLSSMLAAASLVLWGFLFRDPAPLLGGYIVFAVFIVIRHRANIQRLLAGTESKFEFKKKSRETGTDPSSSTDTSPPGDRPMDTGS
jgi:glycerol-3-phosphate acyltransferase PlsY